MNNGGNDFFEQNDTAFKSNNSNINFTGPDDQVVPAVGEHMSLVSAKQGIQGALLDANLALALA